MTEGPAERDGMLARAAKTVSDAEQEIDQLWRESMEDQAVSDRLVGASRALHQASRLLGQEQEIG